MTGPFAQPDAKSRSTGLSENGALDDAIMVLEGTREGDRAEGTTDGKVERWKDSSKSAKSSSIGGSVEDLNKLAKDGHC